MRRVTGIGGIFFKCKDPQTMRAWYRAHLCLDTDDYGTNFEWRQGRNPSLKGFTQWSPFASDTSYFDPSASHFMVSYRVENVEELVALLVDEGVIVLDSVETFEYGKFVHILDVEGNKVELWEPNDDEYDKLVVGRTL